MVCVLVLALAMAACRSASAGRGALPGVATADELHLSFRHDPRTSMVIQWRAHHAPAEVAYRPTPAQGRRGASWRTVTGHAGTWRVTELSKLKPGTAYEYEVRTDAAWSRPSVFSTLPRAGAPLRFDVFADQGDCQSFKDACKVIAGIAADHPAIVIGAGDLSYGSENGRAADDRWTNDIAPWATSAPIAPSWGNHEAEYPDKDPLAGFKARFALPGTEDWYSFTAGPVHFVVLPERYVPVSSGTPYHEFLKHDLASATADPGVHWIVAFGHRPVYSTGTRHGPELRYQRNLVPLFEQYHVQLVIGGHEHNYERTTPINGVTYVVTGGGGAEIYDDFGPQQPWDAVRAVVHEHLRVDATATALHVVTIAADGHTVDDFVLSK